MGFSSTRTISTRPFSERSASIRTSRKRALAIEVSDAGAEPIDLVRVARRSRKPGGSSDSSARSLPRTRISRNHGRGAPSWASWAGALPGAKMARTARDGRERPPRPSGRESSTEGHLPRLESGEGRRETSTGPARGRYQGGQRGDAEGVKRRAPGGKPLRGASSSAGRTTVRRRSGLGCRLDVRLFPVLRLGRTGLLAAPDLLEGQAPPARLGVEPDRVADRPNVPRSISSESGSSTYFMIVRRNGARAEPRIRSPSR